MKNFVYDKRARRPKRIGGYSDKIRSTGKTANRRQPVAVAQAGDAERKYVEYLKNHCGNPVSRFLQNCMQKMARPFLEQGR